MKKIWTRILAFVLVICMVPAITASAHPFTDVAIGSWFAKAVDYVYDNSLMVGTSLTTFSPAEKMNRAMFITVLYRMVGTPVSDGSVPFTDVPDDVFYTDAVIWAYHNNIVNGVSATEFAPARSIDRSQFVTMLYRYYMTVKGSEHAEYDDLSEYTDIDKIPSFAKDAFKWAVKAGIIQGLPDKTLDPAGLANRAQCATMFMRFAEELNITYYEFKITTSAIEMRVGETMNLDVRYTGPWPLQWKSSNETVATVSQDGKVTAVGSGIAYINVTDGVKTVTCKITVTASTLKMEKSQLNLVIGNVYQMGVTYNGCNPLTWMTASEVAHEEDPTKPLITTVSQDGKITALAEGRDYIIVTDGTINAACRVDVVAAPVLTLTNPEVTLNVGDVYEIPYTYTGNKADLTWMSRNESVAVVDENGVVTAVAAGNANIVVSDGTTTKQCKVTVNQPVTEIKVWEDSLFYDGVIRYKGDYVVLETANKPNEATRDIVVSSSNNDIVAVSETIAKGVFRDTTLVFKAAGTATITLTSADGAVSQSYTITVKDGYDFDPGNRQLTPEEFAEYIEKVMCANGFELADANDIGSWRLLTVSKDALTFAEAKRHALSLVHDWYANGQRYCNMVYIGQNDNGKYQFETHWG